MGREIRRVPAKWNHPKKDNGDYIPMWEQPYIDALNEWFENHKKWQAGTHNDQDGAYVYYAEYAGDPPQLEFYPTYKKEDCTHYQIYETVTEGTPVSPIFETLQQMEDWLVTQGYSRKAAHVFCESGYAFTFMTGPGGIKSNINSYDDI